MDEISRITPSIIIISCTQGTNTIFVLAAWEEFEIDRRLEQIRSVAISFVHQVLQE